MQPKVLFDADCSLCSGAVRFARRNAARGTAVRFEPLAREGPRQAAETMVLVDASGTYLRSDAALRLAGYLRAPWPFLAALARRIPRPLRDLAYRAVAANRSRFFGQDERGLPREDEV